MDNLLLELTGKPILNPPALITVVAENFSFLEDQAQFLRATLSIPEVKKLPFNRGCKRLIQFGPLHQEVKEQLEKAQWLVHQYENFQTSICDQLEADLKGEGHRSLIYVNDVSRLELAIEPEESHKFLKLVDKLKLDKGHFVILLYQTSSTPSSKPSKLLRNLEYISNASIRVKSCKAGYFKSIWCQTIPTTKTLIPAKIETSYYTCKIGKFYWSSDLLCFYEKRKVAKNHDINKDSYLEEEKDSDEVEISRMLNENDLDDETDAGQASDSLILQPYTRAQDPEKSRIFYYPDKEDDIDENDPDNDLGF